MKVSPLSVSEDRSLSEDKANGGQPRCSMVRGVLGAFIVICVTSGILIASYYTRGSSTALETSESVLGLGYYLPTTNVLDTLTGGTTIFESFDPSCFETINDTKISENTMSYYMDTSSFYSSISTATGLSGDISGMFTLGFTLNVATNALSSGSVDVSGVSIELSTTTSQLVLSQNCYLGDMSKGSLTEEFVNDVAALPLNPPNPQLLSSWENYQIFLEKYGSHIVTKVLFGSLIRQWSFSNVANSYSESDYRINACVDFEDLTEDGKVNVSTCTGISSEDIQAAASRSTSSQIDVLGGSDQTRNALLNTRTTKLLDSLLNEGRSNPEAIGYEYVSIWELIEAYFSSNQSMVARASTLRQYYEGYLSFGCTNVVNGADQLRFFINDYPGNSELTPVYGCQLINMGCHSEDDCHVGGAGTVAYCYGASCYVYNPPPFGEQAMTPIAQTTQTGSYDEGVNLSCEYTFFAADCFNTFPYMTIYGGA